MSEPTSLWGLFKSFFGIFGSIAKEVIKRYNQPKLVIKVKMIHKKRNSYRDTIKPPSSPIPLRTYPIPNVEETKRLTEKWREEVRKYEEALKVIRNYYMEWHYEVSVTNNSEHTAYKLKLNNPNNISSKSEVDYTKPIPANQTITYNVSVYGEFVGTKPEADRELEKGTNFKLQIEYSNVKGTRYFTLFKSELQVEEQNEFGRVK